jgi:uncharacterized repeat protein (TIGR01451 family)
VRRPARLAIDKTAPSRAAAGQLVRYTITVRNTGGTTARKVTVVDVLPAQLSVERRITGVRMAGGRMTWRVGNLAPGQSKTIAFSLRLDTTARGTRCNSASATATGVPRVGDRACTTVVPVAQKVEPPVTG